jgi:hypothetical protein
LKAPVFTHSFFSSDHQSTARCFRTSDVLNRSEPTVEELARALLRGNVPPLFEFLLLAPQFLLLALELFSLPLELELPPSYL